jgi:hypothetical protein
MNKLFIILLVCAAFVSRAQSVTISSSAHSNTICMGTSVTFTANATGFTNPYYQWYSNGTAISGATYSTYTSTSLNNSDQINVKVNEGPFGGAVTSNGLLLNLDATNPSSYSGSGTTWNNLVTGNEVTNFTIQSGGTYSTDNGGVIRFGNTGGGASSSTGFSNLSAYTVEVWVKPAGTMGGYDPSVEGNNNYTPCFFAEIVHNSGAGNRVNMVLAYNARGLTSGTANNSYRYEAAINNGSWKKHQIPTNYSSDLNNWVQIISTYDGSKLTIYRNGVSLGTSAALGIASLRTPSIGYWIAHRWDMVDAVYGDYSKVMMYDRALSAAEVSANYSAFNARFVDNSVSSSPITTTVNASPAVPILTVLGDACVNKTVLSTTSGYNSYVWYKDDVAISGATTNSFSPIAAGAYKVEVSNGTCSVTSAVTTINICGVTADGSMRPAETSSVLISREGAINNGYVIDERGFAFTKPVPQIAAFDFVNPPNHPTVQRTWTSTINGVTATIRGNPTYTSTNGGGLQLVSGSSIDINGINTATTSFTLSMVVDPPTNTDGHYNVFYDGKSGGGRQGNAIWANFWGTTINVGINSEQGVNALTPVAGITRYDFVYDGTSVKVYKNASIVANGTIPVSNGGWSSNLRIGEEYENVGNFFNGKIYRIKYQKTALDQSAITIQYNAEKTW